MKASVLAYGDYTCPGDWCSYDDGGTFHKVYYVRGGDVVYHDADGEIRLMKNHLYIFPMYRKYHITHNPQDPFQVLWMHLGLLSSDHLQGSRRTDRGRIHRREDSVRPVGSHGRTREIAVTSFRGIAGRAGG